MSRYKRLARFWEGRYDDVAVQANRARTQFADANRVNNERMLYWADRVEKAEAELKALKDPLQKLLNAQEAMLQRWAEAALPGQHASDVQQELWRALHEAADDLREALDRPTEETDHA